MNRGNYLFECINKKCKKHLVGWAETILGGIATERKCYPSCVQGQNRHLCPKCKKELDRYYRTCTECGVETCGGMSVCANCYEK